MAHARWNRKDFDPDLLVERLERLRIPDDGSGSVGFRGDLFFEDVVSVIQRATVFTVPMPESEGRRIVGRALFSAARAGALTVGSLIGEINRGAKGFAEAPEREFVLATSVSVRYFPVLVDTDVAECKISFGRLLPEHLRPGHETAMERTRRFVFGEYPDQGSLLGHYTAVWVAVRGRSGYEAAASALAALDLLRGIWNLALNRRRWSRTTSKRRTPVNGVLLGPVHSLHNPDGGLASEADWYEYDYVEPTQSNELKRRWEHVRRNESGTWACLDRSLYRPELEDAIRRYTRALDTREWDVAFVQLWGYSKTSRGPSPAIPIPSRSSAPPSSTQSQSETCTCRSSTTSKDYRNRSVHGGEGSEGIEAYLYQLKRYVEEVLVFHLRGGHEFLSVEEASRFLDQPTRRPSKGRSRTYGRTSRSGRPRSSWPRRLGSSTVARDPDGWLRVSSVKSHWIAVGKNVLPY